jgi:hypothetical protein
MRLNVFANRYRTGVGRGFQITYQKVFNGSDGDMHRFCKHTSIRPGIRATSVHWQMILDQTRFPNLPRVGARQVFCKLNILGNHKTLQPHLTYLLNVPFGDGGAFF